MRPDRRRHGGGRSNRRAPAVARSSAWSMVPARYGRPVPDVRLRPYRAEDLVRPRAEAQPGDIDFFGFRPENALASRFARDGLIDDDQGNLAIEADGELVGDVGWFAVHHGPPPHGRAYNVGIAVQPPHRGRGIGTAAQRQLADYLFAATRIERLEATTDVENIGEQRALEGAGFTREGVLRHAQWRAGAFHDCVVYSRLRDDPTPQSRTSSMPTEPGAESRNPREA